VNAINRCGARCRDGHACPHWPMHGASKCYMHGGSSPQARSAAKRRLAEEKATKAVARLGLAPVDDPVGELRSLAAEALALKSYFKERVDALDQLRYAVGAGEQVRGELILYERALDRSAKFCDQLARLNLEDRAVRIDEARVVLLVAVLAQVLSSPELNLDSAQQMMARSLLVEALDPS
jgi:hypothetical protein